MGFWSELGKIALDSLESHAASQDPAMQPRLRSHMSRLYEINARELKDGFLNIVGGALLIGRENQEYLSAIPRKEMLALSMYARQQRDKAKAAADEQGYGSDEYEFSRVLESIVNVLDAYIREHHAA